MPRFECMLIDRKDELSAEIFDLLMSLGDFVEFKQMMLSYKRQKNNIQSLDNFAIAGRHVAKWFEGESWALSSVIGYL